MRYRYFIPLVITILLFTACNKKAPKSTPRSYSKASNVLYAKGFSIVDNSQYKLVMVTNPWQKGDFLAKYYLIKSDTIKTPNDGIRIQIPLHSIAVTSCTQYEFLQQLGEIETVTGMCSPELTYNSQLRQNYKAGKITNLGQTFNMNIEQLMITKPQGILFSSYGKPDENQKRIQNSGIPLLYDNEWIETTPLGRAEWIKFVAAFYDKSELADSIFDTIKKKYLEAKQITAKVSYRPTIMTGSNYKGTWYMPGKKNFMTCYFIDAGGNYFYKNDSSYTSLPLNFETVLSNFSNADIWLNAPVTTMANLFKMDERHKLFKSAKNGEVFALMKRSGPNGVNDFWESGVAHPDLVLKDFIWALHPELMKDYEPTYLIKLINN